MKPVFERSIVVVDEDFGPADTSKFYKMEHDFTASPDLTIGYKWDDGLILEASGFYLDSEETFSLEEEPVSGELQSHFATGSERFSINVQGTFNAKDRLRVWVADLDI